MDSDGKSSSDGESPMAQVWPRVHEIFPGLPAQLDLSEEVREGGMVDKSFLQKLIGRGSLADVYLSTTAGDQSPRAIKVVPKRNLRSYKSIAGLHNEVCFLQSLDHPNIVKIHEVMHGKRHIHIVMDFLGMTNLHKHIAVNSMRLRLDDVRDLQLQISEGIGHCHRNGVAHLDLKPENLQVLECAGQAQDTLGRGPGGRGGRLSLRIVDFESAVETTLPRKRRCSTMPFVAPEVMCGLEYFPDVVDMWACGVTMLEMLSGINAMREIMRWSSSAKGEPAQAEQLDQFLCDPAKLRDAMALRLGAPLHDQVFEVLAGMLTFSPQRRWSAQDVCGSSWVTSTNY